MRIYNNVVIIFPSDPTIEFLKPLVDCLGNIFPNAIISDPPMGSHGDDITDETELVIFLGHGTPSYLFGRPNDVGNKSNFVDIATAKRLFNGIHLILFSCNSWDFLRKFQSEACINTFISFGDLPTDWPHINHNRELDPQFLIDFRDEHLEFYKSCLVESMIAGFQAGYALNSFLSIPKQLSLFISKKINEVIFEDSWNSSQKLQMIQLLVDFRNDIKYAHSIMIS